MLTNGVDIVEIGRIGSVIRRWGTRFLDRVFTPGELAFCSGRLPELAARFAAKEAVSKALGVGIWCPDGLPWHTMEVLCDERGKPTVRLHGRAKERADDLGLSEMAISLSHCDHYAVAFVVAQ